MGQSPPRQTVVQTVTAAGRSILRSVNLLRGETPAGVVWKIKVCAILRVISVHLTQKEMNVEGFDDYRSIQDNVS